MVLSQETSVQFWVGVSYISVFICEMRITIVTFLSLLFYLKSHCHTRGRLDFLPCSRSFIVLHFAFSSVIHFELVSVKTVRSVSRFILHVDSQLFQHHLMKKRCFFHSVAFAPLSEVS